jgi:hypothetical protein
MDSTRRCIAEQGVAFAPVALCLDTAGTLFTGWDFEDDDVEEDEDEGEDCAKGGVYVL